VESTLRPDAAEFYPQTPKEPWELFLENKRGEIHTKKLFSRRADGTYTAEYRKLLETKPKPGVRPPPGLGPVAATGAVTPDVVQSWKDAAPKAKPTKPQETKKKKEQKPDPLREALLRVKASAPKEQVLEALAAAEPQASDDTVASALEHRVVPFGLTDRHYLSGEEDCGKSNVHRSLVPTAAREYVPKTVTPELEQAMTDVLHALRQLRKAEAPLSSNPSRRYCVGLREVMRAAKEPGNLKAVLVAPDLERSAALDDKLQQLLQTCKGRVPVVFGLSRMRLGQAIKKSVTISVLGIIDVRGAQAEFDRMLTLA